jgi:peptidoglycan/LPS O-acetylase OafA/YrhL
MNHVNMQLLFAKVPYTEHLPNQLASTIAWNGQFGVQIFFAISGFLITSTTLRRWGSLSAVNVKEFYQLRFARIAPLLLLLLAILSTLHLAHVPKFIVSPKTGGLPRALLAALTFHINLLEARRGYLPAAWDILWSLSVEEMFYLFFPLACRLFRRTRWLIIPLILFVVIGPFARAKAFNPNPVWREYSYLGGMDAIALGCLTAIFVAHHTLSRKALWTAKVAGIALLIFSLCFSLRAYAWHLGRNGLNMTILAIGTCLVIAASAQVQRQAPRILKPLLLLGRRSYEIYLTHIFLVIPIFALFVAIGKPLKAVPALFALVIVCAGVLGTLIGRLYTDPINRRLRTLWNDTPQRLGSITEPD